MDINNSYNTCENCRTKNIDNVKKCGGLIATVVVVGRVAWKLYFQYLKNQKDN